jgi:hypothetical protein
MALGCLTNESEEEEKERDHTYQTLMIIKSNETVAI